VLPVFPAKGVSYICSFKARNLYQVLNPNCNRGEA
jgi:hypothetical protein